MNSATQARHVRGLIEARTRALARPLLSTEAFKIMQLLGLNFRGAIGELLTDLLASLIRARIVQSDDRVDLHGLTLERETALLRVMQDPDAARRFGAYIDRSQS